MAYPDFRAAPTTTTLTAQTTHTYNLPATIEAGDLLIAAACFDGNVFTGGPSGWTAKGSQDGGTACNLRIFALIADGTEDGGTITMTTSASQHSACAVACIDVDTWSGSMSDVVVSTGASAGGNSAPNCDTVTATWGTDDNLYLAIAGMDGPRTVTTWPTSYDLLTSGFNRHAEAAAPSGGGAAIFMGVRQYNGADNDDPAAYVPSGNDQWGAHTLVIKPVVSASGPVVPVETHGKIRKYRQLRAI